MSKNIFISSPYNHDDNSVIEYRVSKTSEYCAKIMRDGFYPQTPVLFGHTMLKYAKDIPSDSMYWKGISLSYLESCVELHVLMLEGWNKSTGVAYEIEKAKEMGIKIVYIEN